MALCLEGATTGKEPLDGGWFPGDNGFSVSFGGAATGNSSLFLLTLRGGVDVGDTLGSGGLEGGSVGSIG